MPYIVIPSADFDNDHPTTLDNALYRPTADLSGLANGTGYRATRLSDWSDEFIPATVPAQIAGSMWSLEDAEDAGGDKLTVTLTEDILALDDGGSALTAVQWQAKVGAAEWGEWANLGGTTPDDYEITGTPDVLNDVRLRAVNAVGGGEPSEPKSETPTDGTVPATAPAAFTIGDWALADAETGGTLDVTINSLPDDGGAEITDIEWTADAGENWHSSGGVVSFQITGLTDDELASIQIAAVNSVGPGPASDVKQETPTSGEVPYPAPEAEGELPDIDVWLGEAMTPLDASEDFTGTDLTYALSPDSDPLPEGVSISSAGVISGTPVGDEDDEGVLSVVVRATDPEDRYADSSLDMTVRLSEAIWTDEPTISQVAATTAPAIRAVGTFVSDAGQMVVEWPEHDVGDIGVLVATHRSSAEIDDDPADAGWTHIASSNYGTGGTYPFANVWVKRALSDDESDPVFSSTGATRAAAGIVVVSGAGLNEPWDIVGITQRNASDEVEIPGGTVPHDLSLILAICALRVGSTSVTLVDGDLENSSLDGTDVVVNYQHANEPSIFVAAGTRETAGAIDPTTGELSSADYNQVYITLALRA